MTTSKEYIGGNLFMLPNDEEGQECLRLMRKYVNRKLIKTIRARGRGSRTAPALANGRSARAYDQSLPLEHSERLSIYMDFKDDAPNHLNSSYLNNQIWEHKKNTNRQSEYIKNLENKLDVLISCVDLEKLMSAMEREIAYKGRTSTVARDDIIRDVFRLVMED